MSWEDRFTARRDADGKKYLTDSAVLDYNTPPDIVLVHADGRRRVMKAPQLISLLHVFREPDEAALEAEIDRLLSEQAVA